MRLAKALDVTTDTLLGMDEFEIETDKKPTPALQVSEESLLGLNAEQKPDREPAASHGSRSKGQR